MKHIFLQESRFLTINLRETRQVLRMGCRPRGMGCSWGPGRPGTLLRGFEGSVPPTISCANYPKKIRCISWKSALEKPFLHLILATDQVSGAVASPKASTPKSRKNFA